VKKHLFSYRHDGAEWGIEILASSPEDARARIAKLPYATYEGEVAATVPARAGFLVPLLVWIRNCAHRARRQG